VAKTLKEVKREYPKLDDFALIQEANGDVWLWGFGEYEEGSVLAGQERNVRLEAFDSMEQARKEYPDVRVDEGVPISRATVPICPPSDFDPMDAGEAWGEDDY
jgi:hypothetical protein